MAPASIICIYIIEFQIRAGNSKHVYGKVVMAVDIICLIFSWRDHSHVTPIKTSGCRWEATILEKLSGKALAVRWPTDDVIFQVDEAICHSMNNTADSW